jgi:hypothetical protein
MPVEDGAVVLVARQAGTATAFIPVAAALAGRVSLFAYGVAQRLWSEAGIDATPIEEFGEAGELLRGARPSLILTGTSDDVADDAAWWRWAGASDVRSVAFVDQWVNYWQRFTSKGSEPRFDCMPDVVAVIDELARSRMVEHGCPPDRIVITGTPALDLLVDYPRSSIEQSRRRLLADHPDGRLVVFAGDTESTALVMAVAALGDALAALAADGHGSFHLAMRPHPRQVEVGMTVMPPAAHGGLVSTSVETADRLGAVLAADVLVGVASMLLYESSSAGIPTISIAFDGQEPADVVRAMPENEVVRNQGELVAALGRALERGRDMPSRTVDATGRFLDALGVLTR